MQENEMSFYEGPNDQTAIERAAVKLEWKILSKAEALSDSVRSRMSAGGEHDDATLYEIKVRAELHSFEAALEILRREISR